MSAQRATRELHRITQCAHEVDAAAAALRSLLHANGRGVEAAAAIRDLNGHLVVVAEEPHADVVVGAVGLPVHEGVGERLGDRDAELEQVGSMKPDHLREGRHPASRR